MQKVCFVVLASLFVAHVYGDFDPSGYRALLLDKEIPVYASPSVIDQLQIGVVHGTQLLPILEVNPQFFTDGGHDTGERGGTAFVKVSLPFGGEGWITDSNLYPIAINRPSTRLRQLLGLSRDWESAIYSMDTTGSTFSFPTRDVQQNRSGYDLLAYFGIDENEDYYVRLFALVEHSELFNPHRIRPRYESMDIPLTSPFDIIEDSFGQNNHFAIQLSKDRPVLLTYILGTTVTVREQGWGRTGLYGGQEWPIVSIPRARMEDAIAQRDWARIEAIYGEYVGYFTSLQRHDNHSNSILRRLVLDRDMEMIGYLLDLGVSPLYGTGSYDGTTSSLAVAVRNQDYEMVRFLHEKGIGFNLGTELNSTDEEMYIAIQANDTLMVELLLELGYEITHPMWSMSNGEFSGGTSFFLHQASRAGNPEIVRLLLEAGADVHQFSSYFSNFGQGLNLGMNSAWEVATETTRPVLEAHGAKDTLQLRLSDFALQNYSPLGAITADRVRIRQAPNLSDNSILGLLQKDTIVRMLYVTDEKMQIGNENHHWILVEAEGGRIGWVYGQFVHIDNMFRHEKKVSF